MILHCNYEEIQALAAGADLVLSDGSGGSECAIAAPSEALAHIAKLRDHLTGDITIETLAQQRHVHEAVSLICDNLRGRLDDAVIEHNPGHEEAVCLYFDFAHVRTVLDRLEQIGAEMTAMIEVMTGGPVTAESAASITFPD